MTNTIKTVQYPKLILVICRNHQRMVELIADVLNYCSFQTGVEELSDHIDFLISQDAAFAQTKGVIADTALVDETCKDLSVLAGFRRVTAPYEASFTESEKIRKLITYSADHYSAEVRCRHLEIQGEEAVFDVVCGGILSRVRINTALHTVEEVLACTSVLTAAGIPLAAILGYFNR